MLEEAKDAWRTIYPDLSEGKPGMVGALLGRSEAQVRRLAALYAVLDQQKAVAKVHLEAALALWQYAEDSVRLIFGDATGDSIEDTIVRAVRTVGEIRDTEISGIFGRNVQAIRLTLAKQTAQANGLIHLQKKSTEGRDVSWWMPGPAPKP